MPRRASNVDVAVVTRAGAALARWVDRQWKAIQKFRESNDFERINGMLLYVDKSVKL